jgi:hypothetical protein
MCESNNCQLKKTSISEKDNVKQMIMSVLGMEDESNQTRGNQLLN